MKKKLLSITVITAALAISASMTAFAGWVQDTNGWAYQNDDGSWRGAGWFTDPTDGGIYYLDPDGYMMTDTHVEGFRLGADGRRIEKTEEEIQKEAERKQREASRPSPSKELAAADLAAQAAKNSNVAVSTTRISYQAEMKKMMDTIFIDARKTLDNSINGSTTEDNLETTYRYSLNGRNSIVCSLWKVSNQKSYNYVANVLDLSYDRNAVSDEANVQVLDNTFRRLMVASLGETTGNSLLDNVFAENAAGNGVFDWSGNTDTGNYYELKCNNGVISIKVTCSEKTAEEIAAEKAAAEAAATGTTETAETAETAETEAAAQ